MNANPWPREVRRRDGRLVPFDPMRIERAVARAAREIGNHDPSLPKAIAKAVATELSQWSQPPGVEAIQDLVEHHLVVAGFDDLARHYSAYRRTRADLRKSKARLAVEDDLKLSLPAVTVLRERYLRKDDAGHPIESTGAMMDRVATFVAAAEEHYQSGASGRWAEEFSRLLRSLDFLPNSPTLMNAGTTLGLLSGCVVLPIEDSLQSIFTTLGQAALIHQAGGGTGFSFSHLRPRGDRVGSTGGNASGPVSFLHVFDAAAGVISQGGRRRGASMAVLDVSHPDIVEFIEAKAGAGELSHFNLSVGAPDAFFRAVERRTTHRLVNPRTKKLVKRLPASELFEHLCVLAHRSGDPGLLFLDPINRANPLPQEGRIEATNPCGEVPLLPYESCNLGSINLSHFVQDGALDWERLGTVVGIAVRFLDDVIDVSTYPFSELEEAALRSRKVGLGMMGLAELLAALRIPYDSDAAVSLAGRIARTIRTEARRASAELARERGPFPRFDTSRFAKGGVPPLRNAQLTSVAPTGTISMIAGTTAGIEPIFAISYVRNVLDRQLVETNPLFERTARDRGFYSAQLMEDIAATGSVRDSRSVPSDVRAAFPTALDIEPKWHLRMQAAVQRFVDAAVSKTVNLPAHATVEDVRDLFLSAWRARVKGITVYRYGSKPDQALSILAPHEAPLSSPVRVHTEFSGGCAAHTCEF